MDQGDSFRAAGGLAFGYATRVAVPIGDLLVPFYNACLDWFSRLQGNAGHVPFEDKPAGEKQAAVNRIGIATAVAFLVPQLLFHWDSTDTLQFVLPMSLGWFVSDPLFVAAIYLWVQRTEDEQQR